VAIKGVVDSLDAVDKAYQEHYSKGQDGRFYIQVEGHQQVEHLKSKLEEFRNNNHQKDDKLKEYESRYKDVDLEDYKRTKAEIEELRSGKGEKFGEIVGRHVEKVKGEYEGKVSQLTKTAKEYEHKATTLEGQLHRVLIDNELQRAASSSNALPTAVEDILLRGRNTFKIVDGKPVPYDPNGQVIYGKDVVTPLSIEEWMKALQGKAPHLFEGSTGGGASGGRSVNGVNAVTITKTQARDTNLYRQAKERAEKRGVPFQVIEG
jgi:hypothetical protein